MPEKTHEVRDPIHVFIRLDSQERRVLNSGPYQRLRQIHQLAMTYLVYPGAIHRRFEPATHTLYVGTVKDARLTVARVDATGNLSPVAEVPTHEGARNGVVTKDGRVYLAHS